MKLFHHSCGLLCETDHPRGLWVRFSESNYCILLFCWGWVGTPSITGPCSWIGGRRKERLTMCWFGICTDVLMQHWSAVVKSGLSVEVKLSIFVPHSQLWLWALASERKRSQTQASIQNVSLDYGRCYWNGDGVSASKVFVSMQAEPFSFRTHTSFSLWCYAATSEMISVKHEMKRVAFNHFSVKTNHLEEQAIKRALVVISELLRALFFETSDFFIYLYIWFSVIRPFRGSLALSRP